MRFRSRLMRYYDGWHGVGKLKISTSLLYTFFLHTKHLRGSPNTIKLKRFGLGDGGCGKCMFFSPMTKILWEKLVGSKKKKFFSNITLVHCVQILKFFFLSNTFFNEKNRSLFLAYLIFGHFHCFLVFFHVFIFF